MLRTITDLNSVCYDYHTNQRFTRQIFDIKSEQHKTNITESEQMFHTPVINATEPEQW